MTRMLDQAEGGGLLPSDETIEERSFSAALICLEGHYTQSPPMGPQTALRVNSIISKTLEKTHTLRKAREALSSNVGIWIWLTRIFGAAVPSLTTRSVGPLSSLNDADKGVSPQESTALIVMNHASIKEDLSTLIKLMHIARNLLVNAEPEVPQDICAAVDFDQMVYQTITLCVNVTSKGYDGEILDEAQRLKLADITELYKKLLVTSLQQVHNWTAKHDRNKMSFWFDVLFEDENAIPESGSAAGDGSGLRPDVAKQQIQRWLRRNSRLCDKSRRLLHEYTLKTDKPPAYLSPTTPLAWNWLPDDSAKPRDLEDRTAEKINPVWNPAENDLVERDRAYGRVSREVDTWWLRARDPNYDDWVVEMPTTDFARTRAEHCKSNLVHRYAHSYRGEHSPHPDVVGEDLSDHGNCLDCSGCVHHGEPDHSHDGDLDNEHECSHNNHECNSGHDHEHGHECEHHNDSEFDHDNDNDQQLQHHDHSHPHHHHHDHHDHDYTHEYMEDMIEDDEIDDDESYGEGLLNGLLTEIPNILDPKQIEALHMIVKSCILDNAGSGLTRAGENLQKTRCRMFLALDCGKSLLRELLVFIAVWEKDDQSLIFQVTTQIVEALHHSALIPYAWNSLRIPKDVISPAQTVLLRLINHMFHARAHSGLPQDTRDSSRDIKLVHFLFSFFRSRIVPECTSLMYLQQQVREEDGDPAEFPVDGWDMERARDGLAQYLDFLTTVAEMVDLRTKLVEWEAVYDLITILIALEAGVPKKPLIELPKRSPPGESSSKSRVERPYSVVQVDGTTPSPPPPPPPLQEPAHKFPWSGLKGQIFTIIATLLQPPPGQSSPGNPEVQTQMVKYGGIVPLLNCCAYDDHNPFAKERVTICLKWLLDGCSAANEFFRELVSLTPQPNLKPPPGGATVSTIRVDGIQGEVKVQVRSSATPPERSNVLDGVDLPERTAGLHLNATQGRETVEEDFMA